MFGRWPRLPVDLLFPTVRRDENSWTTDEYVTYLYDKLKSALASVRDTALLEGQRQKWLYDRKARAVELHLGDKVLVKLDTFRGQRQKLKNQWGDTLYTVVKYMADGIPVYEVENDVNKKRQVLHRAWLLLWLAEPEGKPLRMNRISIESGLIRAELVMPLCRSVKLGMVPRKLIYGLNTAMFECRREFPDLTRATPEGHLQGRPKTEQAIGSPVTSSLTRGACGPCWEMSLQDEHNLPDNALKHDPARGAGNGTGWPLTETPGTQVPRSPLTNLLWELHWWRLPEWATLLLFFAHL